VLLLHLLSYEISVCLLCSSRRSWTAKKRGRATWTPSTSTWTRPSYLDLSTTPPTVVSTCGSRQEGGRMLARRSPFRPHRALAAVLFPHFFPVTRQDRPHCSPFSAFPRGRTGGRTPITRTSLRVIGPLPLPHFSTVIVSFRRVGSRPTFWESARCSCGRSRRGLYSGKLVTQLACAACPTMLLVCASHRWEGTS
jgi:hypothetical protein